MRTVLAGTAATRCRLRNVERILHGCRGRWRLHWPAPAWPLRALLATRRAPVCGGAANSRSSRRPPTLSAAPDASPHRRPPRRRRRQAIAPLALPMPRRPCAVRLRPIIQPVPFGVEPFSGSRLDGMRQLFDRLAAQGFQGNVDIRTYSGRFCLVGNASEGYSLAPDDLLVRQLRYGRRCAG